MLSEYVVHEETIGKYTMKILPEPDGEMCNPRMDDNLGTMACWHRRTNLGDRQIARDKFGDLQDELKHMEATGGVVVPLWLYEHSGMTMHASESNPFSCQWDSGQVGFIYASGEDIRKEYRRKNVNKPLKALVRERLVSEVEAYDTWLRGDVYVIDIENEDGEVVESLGGCFGIDYAIDTAKEMIACLKIDNRHLRGG